MKKAAPYIFAAFGALLAYVVLAVTTEAKQTLIGLYEAKVVQVYDGDTFRADVSIWQV